MAEEKDQRNPIEPAPKLKKLDLSGGSTRRRNMLGEELVLEWNSYTARATRNASKLAAAVCVEAGESARTDKFNTHTLESEPNDIILVPTREPDGSTVDARWTPDSMIAFYFEELLNKRPLNIPHNHKAHITISRFPLPNGVGLRLHLSDVRYDEIRSRKKGAPSDETAAAEDPDTYEDPDIDEEPEIDEEPTA